MTEEIKMCLQVAEEEMKEAIVHLERELGKVRAGKASIAILDGIMVDYYGSKTPIGQVANITTPDSKTISIQPWEKNMLSEIEKAIQAANIGINPQNDGDFIKLYLPPLTEERRISLVKQVKAIAEDTKVSIRVHRKDAIHEVKDLQKDGVPEDMAKRAETQIQDLTNKYGELVNKYVHAKEEEIMTV